MRFRLKEVWTDHEREERAKPGKEDYNLTYRELAKKSGVPIRSIQKTEGGGNITIETLEKLARFFGKKVRDLLDEDD